MEKYFTTISIPKPLDILEEYKSLFTQLNFN